MSASTDATSVRANGPENPAADVGSNDLSPSGLTSPVTETTGPAVDTVDVDNYELDCLEFFS